MTPQDVTQDSDPGRLLKLAMRGLAKSVVLITTADEAGGRHAMAATAVTPLSMEPPLMLFCINRDASSYPTLLAGADFCINILAVDHLPLAHLCSGGAKGEMRFESGAWARDATGIPYLTDAQAAVICTQSQRHAYGTHDIFIGKVRWVNIPRAIDPLVYVDGAYKQLMSKALNG